RPNLASETLFVAPPHHHPTTVHCASCPAAAVPLSEITHTTQTHKRLPDPTLLCPGLGSLFPSHLNSLRNHSGTTVSLSPAMDSTSAADRFSPLRRAATSLESSSRSTSASGHSETTSRRTPSGTNATTLSAPPT
ncbi:hypothetical protein Vretimale_14521, partial [Volvox reticuliferus]